METWLTALSQAKIKEYAGYIAGSQASGLTERMITMNDVVADQVADYFKNEMQYTVTDNKTGQPVGFTRITKISW